MAYESDQGIRTVVSGAQGGLLKELSQTVPVELKYINCSASVYVCGRVICNYGPDQAVAIYLALKYLGDTRFLTDRALSEET